MKKFRTTVCILTTLAGHALPARAEVRSFSQFDEVSISQIKPTGWLHNWLATQAKGLTGHIEVAGRPYIQPAWEQSDQSKLPGIWAFEQTGYWVDGGLRCGYLSGDEALLNRTRAIVHYVLEHPDEDGYLGPKKYKGDVRSDGPAAYLQWPNSVFFRAMMAEYSATGDQKILDALCKHYLKANIRWDMHARNVCNIEPILWLYGKTGDNRLIALAQKLYDDYNKTKGGDATTLEKQLLSDDMPHGHGVSFAEITKLGAILYMYTGQKAPLEASINGFKKVEQNDILASGVYSSEEDLMGQSSLAAHETCDISDYTWSLGYMLMATGDTTYADKIEKAIFNAGFGAVTSDFKQLQYFSSPNQVITNQNSSQTAMLKGTWRMSYRPQHDVECCTGNVNRMFPNYAARMWMTSHDGGLAAVLYGPSEITQGGVTISEETNYPYRDTITFKVHTKQPTHLPLALRIPGWCKEPMLSLNGASFADMLTSGGFVSLDQTFADGDTLVLKLPMTVVLRHWPDNGVSVERGPLVYSLKIDTKTELIKNTGTADPAYPALAMSPSSPFNYALAVEDQSITKSAVVKEAAVGVRPWAIENNPITIELPAKKVADWNIINATEVTQHARGMPTRTIHGEFTLTPPLPDPATLKARLSDKVETIQLIPLGAAKLRITVFPQAIPQ